MMPAVSSETEETRYGAFLDFRLMARFLGYARPHRRWVWVALLLPPLGALSQFAQPLVIQMAVDRHLVTGDMEGFPRLLAALAGLNLLQFIVGAVQFMVNALLGQRVVRDLRQEVFAHLMTMDAHFFARNPSGTLTNRVANDAEAVSQMVSSGLVNLAGDLLLLLALAGGMVLLSPGLSLVVLALMPVVIGIAFQVTRRMRMIQRRGTLLQARMAARITEESEGRDVMRLFHRGEAAVADFDLLNRPHRENADRSNFLEALQFSFVEGASTALVAFLFWYGAHLMSGEALTIGVLTAFIDSVRRLFFPIRDLAGKFTTMQSAMSALERIFALLDTPSAIREPDRPLALGRVNGEIAFRGVDFSYGKEPVLTGLECLIRPGERAAVVGPTGAGKSTLIKLLNRTHDPVSGSVEIDGIPVQRLGLAALRRMVGVVQQETFLFSGTIADNIGLFDAAIGRERIARAAGETGAMEFIRNLPAGLDTVLTERGNNLSSGQRQLLGIARVFAFDPPILVMDEATSSVDAVSERLIQSALERLMANRTSLVIAHRLSTIRHADRIIVLSRGRIVEEGSHPQLMERNGLFATLYALQFQTTREPS
ncbi:MAG: ABC transporter ATP-binding protein [Magnetococcales bacterium]|nr:ABC transporter ATP-binding protein [Magnetococcales bacterium]